MIRGRRGEQWERSFHAAPWVSYAEALCWIYYRDVATIGTLGIVSTDRDYAEMGSGMVAALLSMEAGVEDWREAAPEMALGDALEAGTVKATAAPFFYAAANATGAGMHHKTARRVIEPEEWLDVCLCDAGPPFDRATTAYPKGLVAGAVAGHGFTDIWFSRADITTAFPGEGANQVVQLVHTGPGTAGPPPTQTDFMRSRQALSDAVAALEAEGKEPGKLAILRKVAEAFHAAGYAKAGQTPASVFASMKARSSKVGLTHEAMLARARMG